MIIIIMIIITVIIIILLSEGRILFKRKKANKEANKNIINIQKTKNWQN